jgi:hypothetical protein
VTSEQFLSAGIKWQNSGLPSLPVTAIFHDPLTVDGYGCFTSLGCRTGNAGSLPEQSAVSRIATIPLANRLTFGIDRRALFLSTANFQNVRRIAVRQVEERCIGLWIEHNEFVDILGQWDPSFPLQVSQLYSSEQGHLTSICFYSKQYHALQDEEEDEEDAAYAARAAEDAFFVNEIKIQVDGQTAEHSDDRKVFSHTNLSQVC